jgi:hypothetical protein
MEQRFLDKTGVRLAGLALGLLMLLGSLPFLGFAIWEIFYGAQASIGIFLTAFFGTLTVISGLLARWGFKKPQPPSALADPELERRLLQFARNHNGVVTVSQLAAESPLSTAEARQALEELELQGVCHSSPSSAGGIFYRFPDFLPDGKRTPSEVEFDFDVDSAHDDNSAQGQAQAAQARRWND